MASLRSRNDTIGLRSIYKQVHLYVPTTPAIYGTGSAVNISEKWNHHISSIGLGRQTTPGIIMLGSFRSCIEIPDVTFVLLFHMSY